jgi:uncharacterized protein YbjT (DUF2867 family)
MILLAGGTGHLGSQVAPLLIARGLSVRVLTRDPDKTTPRMIGVELVRGDVRDAVSLKAAMVGVDTVVSAVTGFGPGGDGPCAIDHEGNRNLIRAAEAAGATRYVLVSMHGAGPDHPLELLRMKHRAEEILRESRLAWTIIRPTVFMELWVRIVCGPILEARTARVFGRGTNPINFVSVNDLARFVELAVVTPELRGGALNVGGPENLPLNRVVQIFSTIVGRTASVNHVPLRGLRLAALLMRPIRPDLARMIEAGAQMDTANMTFDAAELRQQYPAIPLTSLAEVVRRDYRATERSSS